VPLSLALRPCARAQELEKVLASMDALAHSAETEHIDSADKAKAVDTLGAAKAWLSAEKAKQDALPKHADPVLMTAAVDSKRESVEAACAALKKQKPKPKPEAAKPVEPAAEAAAAPAAEAAAAPAAEAGAPAAADGMDID
jgi:heat shock protein 4